jgi:exosortase
MELRLLRAQRSFILIFGVMHSVAEPLARTSSASVAARKSLWWQIGVLLLLVAFLYHDVLFKLVRDWWTDPNFSHGFLVPLFCGFVLWRGRKRLVTLPVRPSWFGVLVIAGSLAMLILGTLGAELFLARASLVFLLAGFVIFFLGWPYFRAGLFPWACLFLMIPLPAIISNEITFPLQFLASRLATAVLTAIGIPVLRQGNIIQLPSMLLEVAEACSGIRSLVSLGTLAVIYGYLANDTVWRRSILFAAAVPIAVLANGARIAGTGLVAQYWDPDKAQGFFHEFSGWVIFVVSLGLLFLVHSCFNLFTPRTRRPA